MVKVKKLEGSTLIEVLIAMVIIMVVFSLAIGIFNNVLYSGLTFKKIQVRQQLESFAKEAYRLGHINESMILLDSVTYKFDIDSSISHGFRLLNITASQDKKNMGKTSILFKIKNEE